MCFGGGKQQEVTTPAPSPAPPAKPPEESDIGSARKSEQKSKGNIGSNERYPDFRSDRSTTSGGAGAGGAGLRM